MQTTSDLVPLIHLAQHRAISVFLDFDGVLAPIAPTPDAVQLADEMRAGVLRLSSALDGALALVTGRSLADIDGRIGAALPAAGDHGNQRRRADGTVILLNRDAASAAATLAAELSAATAGVPGLIVEEKASAVALHYRLSPERGPSCDRLVEQAVAGNPTWAVIKGKMVVEARASGVDKGGAVRAFMREQPFVGRIPVVLGDDVTDEDGFAAAHALGGLGIKVGPGPTEAALRVPNQSAVLPLIEDLTQAAEGVS